MSKNLTPRQRRALEALITSGNVSDAAEKANVSRDTIYRWQKQPEFMAALNEAVSESISSLSRRLVNLGNKAIASLSLALTGKDVPVALQVRAADIVLGRLLALRELHDLEWRIAAIERAMQNEHEETS